MVERRVTAFSIVIMYLYWNVHRHPIACASENSDRSSVSGRMPYYSADFETGEIKENISMSCGKGRTNGSNVDYCVSSMKKPDFTATDWSASNKLTVFVLPHSHNDPGWGWTFESYYESRTKYILDNMAKYMPNDPEMKLVWAEICFFDRWWRRQDEQTRNAVRRLVAKKQLEFVGGGWVMPDEATVHYSSFVTQFVEGHQWLNQRFNFTPKNGWTIDPFGLSSTFALLSKRAGIKSLTFLRIPYAMKNYLAGTRSLEFIWRQFWDSRSETGIFSHVMPYDSYDTRSSCGLGQTSCRALRKEILGERSFNDFDSHYLNKRSLAIVDELREKAKLFNTTNVLLPFGGDFAFQTKHEWTTGLSHLKKMMQYINGQTNLFTEIKICTLEEYMSAVQNEMAIKGSSPKILKGDFFTYNDRRNDYWSGYFTSRVFHKVTERQLMALTRTSQLLFTLMAAEAYRYLRTLSVDFVDGLLEKLITTRRAFGLFQHHDGISGTSSDDVVTDFAKKLDAAITDANFIIQQCIFVLANLHNFKLKGNGMPNGILKRRDTPWKPMLYRNRYNELWSRRVINVNETHALQTISVVNSLPDKRFQLIRLVTAHAKVKVTDNHGKEVQSEVYVQYQKENQNHIDYNTYTGEKLFQTTPTDPYELMFWAECEPLSNKIFHVVYSPMFAPDIVQASVQQRSSKEDTDLKNIPIDRLVRIGGRQFSLTFSSEGDLMFVSMNGQIIPLNVTFLAYSTESSGLYLFLPKGEAKTVRRNSPEITVVEGDLESYVQISDAIITTRFILSHGSDARGVETSFEVENLIDIRGKENFELIMRLSTEIKNGDIFYTDSNGFQMMRRKRLPANPIQGNYYPVATSAFIEDSSLRMTLLTAQPGGGSSLRSGEFEIMLDRIVNQDDDRGIGQGGTDNLLVLSRVKIMLEKPAQSSEQNDRKIPALSLEANHRLQQLLHPVHIYVQNYKEYPTFSSDYRVPDSKLIPCDISLVGTFALPKYNPKYDHFDIPLTKSYTPTPDFGLVVTRISFDERFSSARLQETCDVNNSSFGNLKVSDLFGALPQGVMQRTSLTFSKPELTLNVDSTVRMNPMDIYSFRINFRKSIRDKLNYIM